MLLYIHIPFCDSKCHYCAFNSYTEKNQLKQQYMQALTKQLKQEISYLIDKNEKIETVFIGGGTPSCVKAEYYEDIFNILQPYLTKECEITTEANPNSASKQWQEKMHSFGVNRISFGVQSFNDEKLKKLGRSHNKNSAIKAIQNANCIGFNSINCDIIYGVAGDSFESLKRDFDTISTLPVTHLSAYSLTIEEGTKFFLEENSKDKKTQKIKIDDEELSYKIFEYLKFLGFHQYEISNFSKESKYQSKHNFGYWEHKEYLGVGAGAVGYKDKSRYYTKKSIEDYIKNPIFFEKEILTDEDVKIEKVLLGFRSINGVELSLFNKEQKDKIFYLVENDKLIIDNNRVYNKNFLLADEISLYILE